jgi:hypothetical protein
MDLQKNQSSPKLIVTGFARHGKDTVCKLLQDYGYTFESSSHLAGLTVVYPVLKDKYNYKDFTECFKDRVNHRQEWFELIAGYNKNNPIRLGLEILSKADIYCGIRRFEELDALRKKTNCITVWVDSSERLEGESVRSCTVTKAQADIILYNNGTKDELKANVRAMVELMVDERTVITSGWHTVIEIRNGTTICRDRLKGEK